MEEDNLVRIHNFQQDSVLGNIYCGYVKDILKNLNGAFVEFDKDKKGYLALKNHNENLHQGDKVLVQVSGDRIKSKEYALTSNINLNSDCLVLTVGNTDISISKKITDKNTREELKENLKSYANEEYGFILRTNSVNFSGEEIKTQAESLIEQWLQIKKSFEYAAPKSAIIRKNNLELFCKEYVKRENCGIITDNKSVFEKLTDSGIGVIYHKEGTISLSNKYCLDKYMRQVLNEKVWLKSGAYLVIEPTEALTVIDVNTGKAGGKTNREETIKKINIEAAREIVRQIQLRNLSGIIIVDFINMKQQEDYQNLERMLREMVKNDFTPCYIIGFTRLGLMEISRKKKEKPLYEVVKKI
jgi:ribonuclease G